MNKKRFKYRIGSIFYQFSLWILLLVLILICAFFIFSYRSTCENFEKQLEESDYNTLDKMIMAVDLTLKQLAQELDDIASEGVIVDAAVVPGEDQYERNTRVLQLLKETASKSDLIDNIYFYERTGGLVYAADGEMNCWDQFGQAGLLENCFQTARPLKEEETVHGNYLMADEQYLCLYQHVFYRLDEPMATLVIKINSGNLVNSLLYDHLNRAVMVNISDQNGKKVWNGFEPDGKSEVISLTSEYTGWNFQYGRSPQAGIPVRDMMNMVFPSFLIFVVIAVICSFFIVSKLYQPISRMVSNISGRISGLEENGESENEIDYVSHVFEFMEKDSAQMKQVIKNVSGEITERLMNEIMDGQQIEEAGIERTLADISSPFTVRGNYMAVVCRVTGPERMMKGDLEYGIFFKGMQQMISQKDFSGYGTAMFLVREKSGVIVMEFSEDKSVVQIKSFISCLREELSGYIRKMSLEGVTGCGKLYNHISDLFYSYKDANEEVQYQLYYSEGETEEDGQNNLMPEENKADLYRKQRHVAKHISSGEFEAASELLNRMIADICEPDEDKEALYGWCSQILDLFVEEILEFKMETSQVFGAEEEDVYTKMALLTDKNEIKSYLMNLKECVLSHLRQQYDRRQYQIVLKAKEYLEDNYSDSSLSLNRIAEAVGINAAYLSTLFNEYEKTGITDYLNSYRIGRAMELLEETNIIIKEIGYKTGFNTIQNFNRVFKKYMGCTPTQYRDKKKQ